MQVSGSVNRGRRTESLALTCRMLPHGASRLLEIVRSNGNVQRKRMLRPMARRFITQRDDHTGICIRRV